jgi:hypothetical protein
MSVHATNITQGPEGLVTITLLFGNTPVIPNADQVPVTQAARLRAMHTAKAEYEQLLAERLVETALRKKPPSAADYVFDRGNWVYVYRADTKSWTEPHQVAAIDEKCVFVHLAEQFGPRAYKIAQLKPALSQKSQPTEDSIGSVLTHWPTRFTEILTAEANREAPFGDAKRAKGPSLIVLSLIDRCSAARTNVVLRIVMSTITVVA